MSGARAAARRPALVLAAVTFGVAAWSAYLAATLPDEHLAPHWRMLWTGLDLGIAAAAGATLAALLRRPARAPFFAAVTGTVLLCDAWFDVLTSHGAGEQAGALALALVLELPLAAFCYRLAWRTG